MTQKIGQTQGKPEDFRMNFQSAKRKKKIYKDSYHQQNHIQKCRLNKGIPRKAYGQNIYL